MITEVEGVGAAVSDLDRMDATLARFVEKALAEGLVRHGAVVVRDRAEMDLIKAALHSRHLALRETLFQLGKQGRFEFSTAGVERGVRMRRAADIPAGHQDPEEDPDVAGLEHASVAAFGSSQTLTSLHTLCAEGRVPRGGTRKEFWERVLAPLASKSNNVTIFDGYAVARLDSHSNERNHALLWLVSQLAHSPGKSPLQVKIYARRQERYDTAERYAPWLGKFVNTGRIGKISLTLANGAEFPHDRHIRFSCGGVVTIGAGIDRFAGAEVSKPEGVNWGYKAVPFVRSFEEDEKLVADSWSSDTHDM